jgi:hypothetical protein
MHLRRQITFCKPGNPATLKTEWLCSLGMPKQAASRENLNKLFANQEPAGYEITRGKLVKRGQYEFPVVLVDRSQATHIRRRFSSIVVVDTGNNDWAVDKLP